MTDVATTIERWASVMRYHRASQLWHRLGRRTIGSLRGGRSKSSLRFDEAPPTRPARTDLNAGSRHRCQFTIDDLRNGRLVFLNLGASLGRPLDWRLHTWPAAPALWAFHLQYHEFLDALAVDADADAMSTIWRTLESWCDVYELPPSDSVAWHPYCISKRIGVWCRLLATKEPPESVRRRLERTLAEQVDWLTGRFERDLGGNHLWENAKSLAIAGSYFDGPRARRWLDQGIAELKQCLHEQVLPSGEHFERSCSYQADLAAGMAELAEWLEPMRPDFAGVCRATFGKMQSFLDQLRHSDGCLPMFGDSFQVLADGDCMIDPKPVHANQRRDFATGSSSAWVGHYFVHRQGTSRLVFDAGNMGPDELPAHAHADLLGFELEVAGVRLATDSGTFCYAGEERNRFRGSVAHNVLTIDGLDHADLWSTFRMGRRGHVVDRSWGRIDGNVWVRARHDAYARWGCLVDRYWLLSAAGPWFSVHVVHEHASRNDGPRDLCERIHWHPDADVRLDQGGRRALIQAGATLCTWILADEGDTVLDASPFSPDFYVAVDRPCLRIERSSNLPAVSAWCVFPGDELSDARVVLDGDWLRVGWKVAGSISEWAAPVRR